MQLDLVTTNVYSKHLSDKILICGTCVLAEWKEIVEKLINDHTILSVCLEETHLNTAIEKIASMLVKGSIKEIMVLTKDGSPHCIGLHFAVEWALKLTKSEEIKIQYYGIEHGKLIEVSAETIKEKRHLSK